MGLLEPVTQADAALTRPEGHAGTLRVSIWTALQQLFGFLFAITLAWGILAFPLYKHAPIGYLPVVGGLALAALVYRRTVAGRIERTLSGPSEWLFVCLVVALAVAVRVAAVLAFGDTPVSDHAHYNEAALSLVRGAGYPPSAFYPPGMAFWLFLVYSVLGESLLAAQLVNALIGGLFAWLTYAVARCLVTTPAARLAALLVALFPSLVLYGNTLGYGPLLGCGLFLAVWLSLRRGPATRHPWWYVALIGVVIGITTFLKPIGLLLPLAFGLSYWRRGTPALRSARNTVILAVALFATILPWSIRNTLLFGEYVSMTTTGGAGLWVANHPGATGLSVPFPDFPPGTNEVQRDRILWQRAWRHIRSHPADFARLVPTKAAYMWGTSTTIMAFVSADRLNARLEQALKLGINVAWTFLCFFFVVAIWRDGFCRSPAVFWPLVCLLAYIWGIHQFYEAQCKYVLPFLPVMCIGAATALLRRPVRT